MRSRARALILVTLCGVAAGVPGRASATDVVVLGLFSGSAVLRVDGAQHVLKVGDVSPEGVRLLAADADHATVEFDGEQRKLPLGDHIAPRFVAKPKLEQVTLTRDRMGMFRAPGQINGRSIDMMVDTGATYVAMNRGTAQHLGLGNYRLDGKPVSISTANGITTGYLMTLRSVRVGGIEVGDVTAVVQDGDFPEHVLLGMSFLGTLDIEHRKAGVMVLKQRR